MEKVLLLGHLGFLSHTFDGQTMKTRNVYELLKTKTGEIGSLDYFDTQDFRYDIWSPFRMVWKILHCSIIIYIPAHNNLRFLFPVIYFLCKFRKVRILYIVVGGWLDEYLTDKKLHIFLLSRIQGIFPQSNQLCDSLKLKYKFKNVCYFPNFRLHSFVPNFESKRDKFKIVFMARIFKLKGIDKVFELSNYIKNSFEGDHRIIIDFYGPIHKEDETYFYKEIRNFSFISYKGILDKDQIYPRLNEYDLLVLPTRYPGEGFPGTILDAYISGIPVITSNWRYISEFVENGKTGFLFDLENSNDFFCLVEKLYYDRDLLNKMKKCAYERSKEFSSESAWEILKGYLI